MRVAPYDAASLSRLQALVNLHLAAVAPGWSLAAGQLARHLVRDETEDITDPWVAERRTLCAYEGERLLAAAHLLRYADRDDVGEAFRGLGEIGWALGLPEAAVALTAVLAAGRGQFADWRVQREAGWGAGLPAGPFGGVADAWPHIADALGRVGFRPAAGFREALYGGSLDAVPAPGPPPIAGLSLRKTVGRWGTRFAALLGVAEIGHADGTTDLTLGGAMPAPLGWAELSELWVGDDWRNRGIGAWLVRQLVAWLRLGGATRIVLAVTADDEGAGAGRFYRRFGWQPFTRSTRLWLPADH